MTGTFDDGSAIRGQKSSNNYLDVTPVQPEQAGVPNDAGVAEYRA